MLNLPGLYLKTMHLSIGIVLGKVILLVLVVQLIRRYVHTPRGRIISLRDVEKLLSTLLLKGVRDVKRRVRRSSHPSGSNDVILEQLLQHLWIIRFQVKFITLQNELHLAVVLGTFVHEVVNLVAEVRLAQPIQHRQNRRRLQPNRHRRVQRVRRQHVFVHVGRSAHWFRDRNQEIIRRLVHG